MQEQEEDQRRGSADFPSHSKITPGFEGNKFGSYRDSIVGNQSNQKTVEEDLMVDGDVSNDYPLEDREDDTWFSLGMTREEKLEAHQPWRNSLIVKLVGRSIGCHYLW